MNRFLALLLALSCWLSAGAVRAALTDPAQIQTEAYVNLVQADQSLDAGRLDEALALYKTARDYYRQLAKEFPGWEPRVIQYRKTYCDNQILDVERRQKGLTPEDVALPVSAPVPDRIPATPLPVVASPALDRPAAGERSVEVDYLKSRIASLEAELIEFDTLQDELEALTAANAQLQKDLEAASPGLGASAPGDLAALDGLRAELAAKEDQIQALQQDIEARQQRGQALNDLEAKVNELGAQNERLNLEIKTLDAELDDAEVRADQAELRAQRAEEKLAEAEARALQAEKDLATARADQAGAEKELAALQRKSASGKPAREKPASKAKAEPETPALTMEPTPEPDMEETMPAPVSTAVVPSVPPKAIPDSLSAADYVRQLLQDGDNEAALATVQEARQAAPADMNLALIEGIALIRLQRYSEAAGMLIDLAQRNPRNAEIHATLGAAMMGAGFYEEARETLLKAAKLDKNLPECLYNLAQLYSFIDPIDLKLARRYYKQARDLGLAADPQLDQALK